MSFFSLLMKNVMKSYNNYYYIEPSQNPDSKHFASLLTFDVRRHDITQITANLRKKAKMVLICLLFCQIATVANAGFLSHFHRHSVKSLHKFDSPGTCRKKSIWRNSGEQEVSKCCFTSLLYATRDGSEETSPTSRETLVEKSRREAAELRQRAQQILAEANAAEMALKESRSMQQSRQTSETDAFIEQLFESKNCTPPVIAEKIIQERWSQEQLVSATERLHERRSEALGSFAPSMDDYDGFQIGDVRNAAVINSTEWQAMDGLLQSLVEAAFILDKNYDETGDDNNGRWSGRAGIALSTRLKELQRSDQKTFERKYATSTKNNSSDVVQGYTRQTLGSPSNSPNNRDMNMTNIMELLPMVPLWVPASFLPFVLIAKEKLDPNDAKAIRDKVLTGTEFFCTNWERMPSAAIYRGNFRPQSGGDDLSPAEERNQTAFFFHNVQQRLALRGMADRVQLFFLPDPEWRPNVNERESEPKPVILALPKVIEPEQASERGKTIKAVTGISSMVTVFTAFAYAVACYALNTRFFESVVNQNDFTVLVACIPVFLGTLGVQALHEVAHFVVAKKSGMKIGLPVLLPSLQLGTFGSITPLRSFPPDRSALLDFALSGPMATLALSGLLMLGGISATLHATAEQLSFFPVIPAALLKCSFLTGSIMSMLAPKTMLVPLSQPIPIHPAFVVGFAGLISSALNLLPIGRLDGGRACSAVFGSRFNSLMTLLTLSLMAILSISGSSTIAIFWGALVVLFQRQPDIPIRNEITEVDDVRFGVYTISLVLALLALAPFPGGTGFL